MPQYDNQCYNEECGAAWEEHQAYTEEPFKICPACGEESVRRVYSLGYISIKNANTLGALAEQNNKRFGGKKDEIMRSIKQRPSEFKGVLPDTAKVMQKSDFKTPWWRADGEAVDQSLAKMTPEQTTKYVMEGKKPISTEK